MAVNYEQTTVIYPYIYPQLTPFIKITHVLLKFFIL